MLLKNGKNPDDSLAKLGKRTVQTVDQNRHEFGIHLDSSLRAVFNNYNCVFLPVIKFFLQKSLKGRVDYGCSVLLGRHAAADPS